MLADEEFERCAEVGGRLSVSDGVLQLDLLLGDSAVRFAVRREVWDRAVQLLEPVLEPQEASEAGGEAFGWCNPPLQSLLLQQTGSYEGCPSFRQRQCLAEAPRLCYICSETRRCRLGRKGNLSAWLPKTPRP